MFRVDPYLHRTYDRRHYHCWHLICDAWLELTGEDLRGQSAKLDSLVGLHGHSFELIDRPTSPCIVVMLQGGTVPHAGLYRNGRVLHIRQTGPRYERLADATRGFAEVRYYAKRHSGHGPTGAG